MEIPITKSEVDTANEEAAYLFGYLRKKYSNESTSHLDIIMNSLCFALLRMMHLHVRKKDRGMILDIMISILKQGIEKD